MKRYDRKVALKLINKYADECNRVEEEKNSLQLEVNDLRANIIVNKEIIDKLFNPNLSIDEKSKELILNSKKEINILTQRIEQLNKENSNLRIKVSSYEKIINSDIEEYRESTNELNDKIFILENENQKKENIIMSLNKQILKLREKDSIEIKNEDVEGNEEENEEDSEEKVINSITPNEIYITQILIHQFYFHIYQLFLKLLLFYLMHFHMLFYITLNHLELNLHLLKDL